MFYTRFQVVCNPAFAEILIAEFTEAGFESFLETENGFEAYTENDAFDKAVVEDINSRYVSIASLSFTQDTIQKKNWNEEWERNLQTIVVDDKCLVRAEFHPADTSYQYQIVITPKMSFGTGHHQTTWLMLSNQMQMDHQRKRVMDAGCGTAILSIMASMLGATSVEAFDIDEWSVINAQENIMQNHCANINIQQGKINEVNLSGKFDIILANINKNILLQEMKQYADFLSDHGQLLISGFYTKDADVLVKEALLNGLHAERQSERETWAAVLFTKR